jgi:type I restriction enzyme R subunit
VSEYLHVEKPFLDQLGALGWTVIDQGQGFIPTDPAGFRDQILRQPSRTLLEANEAAHGLLLKAQVDVNECSTPPSSRTAPTHPEAD